MKKLIPIFACSILVASFANGQDVAPVRLVANMRVKPQVLIRSNDSIYYFGMPVIDSLNDKYKCSGIRPDKAPADKTQHVYVLDFPGNLNMREAVESYMKTGMFYYVQPEKKK